MHLQEIKRVEEERRKREEKNVKVFISSVPPAPVHSPFFSSHSSRQAGPLPQVWLVLDHGDNVPSTACCRLRCGIGFPLWLVLAVLSYLFFF